MVYVDDTKNRYGRMIMSHMIADTIEELHAMADKLDIDKKHFQNKDNRPHYDICQAKRKMAIEYFRAKPVTTRDIIRIFQSKEK